MTDPTNVFAMDDIKFMTGYNVEPVVASETAITEAVQKYYPTKGGAKGASGKPGAPGSTAGVSALDMASRGLEEMQVPPREQCKEAHPTTPPAMIQAGFTPEEAETATPMKARLERATTPATRAAWVCTKS